MANHLFNTVEQYDIYIDGVDDYMVYNSEGIALLDFYNDEGVVGCGYNLLRETFSEASNGAPYYVPRVFKNKDREMAANELCYYMGYDKAFFCNSGTEAVEAAIKVARRYNDLNNYPNRDTIYTFYNAFHGRTYGSLTASDSTPYHKEGFGPFLPGFKHFTWPDEIDWYRCLAVLVTPAFVNHSDFLEYPPYWLAELRNMCSSTGALFMVDEIQTGFGRCGAWKLMDVYGIQPDLICVGKGIANGLPVAGILTTEGIASVITPGRHFSTFGGWPMGMKAINKVIEFVEPMIVSGEIDAKGEFLRGCLKEKSWAKCVRGRGMLTVCNVDVDARRVCEIAMEHGILMATHRPWCLKLSPPLIMPEGVLSWTVEQIDHVITKHGKDF